MDSSTSASEASENVFLYAFMSLFASFGIRICLEQFFDSKTENI